MNYPIVEKLVSKTKEINLQFEILKAPPAWGEWQYFKMNLKSIHGELIIPIMDDFKDRELNKPQLILNLALFEREIFEEAEDYLVWCKELGIPSNRSETREIWFMLKDAIPKLNLWVGEKLECIPHFDYELNMGNTQALRES